MLIKERDFVVKRVAYTTRKNGEHRIVYLCNKTLYYLTVLTYRDAEKCGTLTLYHDLERRYPHLECTVFGDTVSTKYLADTYGDSKFGNDTDTVLILIINNIRNTGLF